MKVIFIVGNRPQFMKAAIVQRAWESFEHKAEMEMKLIHTGQHYDKNLSDIFFKELGIKAPDYNLSIGSGNITDQVAMMLQKLKPIFEEEKPDAIAVYGDTNSTLGGSVTAAHMNIPVIHIEAGERIFIRENQPEEINRVITDSISSLCLVASKKAVNFLKHEGVNDSRVKFVGDTMYDLFLWSQKKLTENPSTLLEQHGLEQGNYVLSTLHRAENTDNTDRLKNLLNALDASDVEVILPLHPRTKNAIEQVNWQPKQSLRFIEPCGYLDLMQLLQGAKFVVTDSGGLSRESFWAKKLSLVPMSAPPWAEIHNARWMSLLNPDKEITINSSVLSDTPSEYPNDLFGDGTAGDKIVSSIYEFVENKPSEKELWLHSE